MTTEKGMMKPCVQSLDGATCTKWNDVGNGELWGHRSPLGVPLALQPFSADASWVLNTADVSFVLNTSKQWTLQKSLLSESETTREKVFLYKLWDPSIPDERSWVSSRLENVKWLLEAIGKESVLAQLSKSPGSRTEKTLKVSLKWWKKETISLWWTWYCRTVVESGVTTPCGYLSTIQSGAVAARVGKTSTFDLDLNQLRDSRWASQRLLTSGTHRRPPAASLWSSSGERMRMIKAQIHFFGKT